MPAKKSRSVGKTVAAKQPAIKNPVYEVRRSSIQGRGGFATRPIRKGQRVDEYVGERISHEEADRRYDDKDGRHHTFLFVLDDDVVLDARTGGSNARFLNHSCEPNCETVIENERVWIKSLKAIAPEAELLYDYRFEWQDEYEPEDIRYYACRCGTAKCRGTIVLVPPYLRPTVRQWLAGEDVERPRKPRKKSKAKKGAKKSAKKAVKKGAKKAVKKGAKKAVKKGAKKAGKKAASKKRTRKAAR